MGQTKVEDAESLYAAAVKLAEQSQPEEALMEAQKLWNIVKSQDKAQKLPALNLLGEISVELGNVEDARNYFEQAVKLDPDGAIPETSGGGAEKFLWLAQLCEEGGQVSVGWYEKGVKSLQGEIANLESALAGQLDEDSLTIMRIEKKRKLANALCSVIEVYMTDLSWEDDAEARCESLIVQAMAVEEEASPEVLQTFASIRLSQEKKEEAQAILKQSLSSWQGLDPEDPAVPDFAIRISLARLLMEAELEELAMSVIERLISEDDSSVEAWYLGGWCQYLAARSREADDSANMTDSADEAQSNHLAASRHWLKQAIKLYSLLEYEDERLLGHAQELVAELDKTLGNGDDENDGDAEELIEWNGLSDDEGGDRDLVMNGT